MRRTHKRLLNFGPPTRHAKELLDKAASVSPVRREPELNVPIDSLEAARRLAEKAKSLDLLRQGDFDLILRALYLGEFPEGVGRNFYRGGKWVSYRAQSFRNFGHLFYKTTSVSIMVQFQFVHLTALTDWVPFKAIRKRQHKLITDDAAEIAEFLRDGKFALARWRTVWTWIHWFRYLVAGPIDAVIKLLRRFVAG